MNRQFYIYKMKSNTFYDNNYEYNVTRSQAKKNGQIVSIGDSQMLRCIRKLTGKIYDKENIEMLYNRKNEFKKKNKGSLDKKYIDAIYAIDQQIYDIMFVDSYLSLVINSNLQYRHIIKHGVTLNGKKYKVFSCSASQARVSTVILVKEMIWDKLYALINNDRKNIPLNPSKENAYFGLASSATQEVAEPKVIVVADCFGKVKSKVNWVSVVNESLEDDIVEQKEVEMEFNLFDGMGIISPNFANIWAKDLELDYSPSEFCIRHSFIKGMVCQFDFVEFCKQNNNGNYMVKTLYGNYEDVRNADIILTESQFKMWNCYNSYEQYNECCHKNGLTWGVTQYSPKISKDILTMNYQSLQTLLLDNKDIKDVCQQSVDLFSKITRENIYYTILFMLGENINEDTMGIFIEKSDNYWLKSLLLDNTLIHDRYIQTKIYDNISKKITNTYLGEIHVDGNYQCMVSDPYAFMEHVCGMPVRGLLERHKHYSGYWNNKDVKIVNAMRSPLTYRSEHNLLNLVKNKQTEYWYQYLQQGIIFNVHGDDIVRHADSDFDYDIVATTSNQTIINAVDTESLPVAYDKATTGKKMNTQQELREADMLAFGSKIGGITNKGSSIFAMLPMYDKDSEEYKELEKRLILIRVAQGNEIDRAKGVDVKPFPKHWSNYTPIEDEDDSDVVNKKNLFNSIIVNKKPYFFRHRYPIENKKYKQYYLQKNTCCVVTLGKTIDELESCEDRTPEEQEFLDLFYYFSPLINTPCVMNELSKYMSKQHFKIKQALRVNANEDIWYKYVDGMELDSVLFRKIQNLVVDYFKTANEYSANRNVKDWVNNSDVFANLISDLKKKLFKICSNKKELTEYMVVLFYTDLKSKNKNILWEVCGKQIYENVEKHCTKYNIPIQCPENGDFEYMGKQYKITEFIKEGGV